LPFWQCRNNELCLEACGACADQRSDIKDFCNDINDLTALARSAAIGFRNVQYSFLALMQFEKLVEKLATASYSDAENN